MTMLIIFVLSFAFVNMFIMLVILGILPNKARQICDKTGGYDFGIEIAAVEQSPLPSSVANLSCYFPQQTLVLSMKHDR